MTRSHPLSTLRRRHAVLSSRSTGRPERQRASRWALRLLQLYAGLWLYGVSGALMVRANLGLDPWDVLHQGISRHSGLAIGTVSIIVGAVVLLGWIPIRQRPGLGTLSNVVIVGFSMNVTLQFLAVQHGYPIRSVLLLGGILVCGLATGMYISAGLGPGPRDGLMTGWSRHTGISIRLTRTVLEVCVLVIGWLLGGSVGIGTVLFAVAIGPLSQFFLSLFGYVGSGANDVVEPAHLGPAAAE